MPLPQAFIDLVSGSEFDALRASRDLNGIADILNKRDQRGYVPIVEIARYCSRGITGGVQALIEIPLKSEIFPGVTMDIETKGALHTVLNLVQQDFRLEACDTDDPKFGAVCDMLILFTVMSAEDKAALLALGDNRMSRAEKHLDRFCTGEDVRAVVGGE